MIGKFSRASLPTPEDSAEKLLDDLIQAGVVGFRLSSLRISSCNLSIQPDRQLGQVFPVRGLSYVFQTCAEKVPNNCGCCTVMGSLTGLTVLGERSRSDRRLGASLESVETLWFLGSAGLGLEVGIVRNIIPVFMRWLYQNGS